MKSIVYLLVNLFAALSIPALAIAQATEEVKTPNSTSGFEAWGRELQTEVLASDVDAIANRFDEKATVVWQDGTHSQGPKGIEAFLKSTLEQPKAVVKSVKNKRFEIDTENQQFGDTMVAHGKLDQTLVLRSGREVELKCTWTASVQMIEGDWKIISLQMADNVFDNALLKTTRTWLLVAAIVGSLLGFTLGWFFTWFITRSTNRLRENRTLEY